ncbi:MAG: hypothetical protein GYA86_10790, partial [Firmicutes bacterium]|nr:hypothetical protein [Bacillota bacterium]
TETAEEITEEPGDPAEPAPEEAAPAREESPTTVSTPPEESDPESDPGAGADQAEPETAGASEEEGGLFPPEKEQETETGDTGLEAAALGEEEPLTAGTAPDEEIAPEAVGQPKTDEEAEPGAVPPAVDELLPGAGTFPEELLPKAEMAEKSEAGAEEGEEEYLFSPKKERETESEDTGLEAATLDREEPLPAGTAPDEGFAPEADGQPETDEGAELEAAPPAVDELLPEASTFPEEIPPEAEMAEESEAGAEELEPLAVEPADLTRSFDSSRAEQLLEQIYTDQEKEPHGILAAGAGEPDGRAQAALIHARQVIAGIMLVLGGAIAAATTYFYAVSGTIYYLISAAAVIFGLAGFFRGLSGWLKLRPWHNDDNSTPQQEPR